MRRYFYGVKVQVLVNAKGIPVEFGFVPGCESDVQALKKLPLSVAAESKIYGDAAYTDYQIEDQVEQTDMVELMIQRKNNSKRADQPWITFLKEQMRKGIETSFSQIKALFLRTIHAVLLKGFYSNWECLFWLLIIWTRNFNIYPSLGKQNGIRLEIGKWKNGVILVVG